jgi:endonuclease-8
MPEGDTIFRAARTLHRALAGRVVTGFDARLAQLARIEDDAPLTGRTVDSVAARGKHLLMAFSGDLILHTHMRMNGSWHLYRPGERWRRPQTSMRVVVATDAVLAVGFDITVAEFLTGHALGRHPVLGALGPDLLGADVDVAAIAERIRARGPETIGDVLLDQRVVAGIGNVIKAETLFLAGVSPFTPVDGLTDARIVRVVEVAKRLLTENVAEGPFASAAAHGRRTTRSLDPGAPLWVYDRSGKPCRRCGAPIRADRTGADARVTYWCPACQAE